jgi:hypothetical protein
MPEQNADVLEILIRKMGKDRDVDAVPRKCPGVLGQPELCEPIGYFLHRRPRPAEFRLVDPPEGAILPDRSFAAKPTKTVGRRRERGLKAHPLSAHGRAPGGPLGPFTYWEVFRAHHPPIEGDHHGYSGRANESAPGTGAPRASEADG